MGMALLIALVGTVVLTFVARQAHCRATATGAPMGTFRNLAIVAGGFVCADLIISIGGLGWSPGQAITATLLATLLGLYLPQVLAMTGNALTHAAHGAARGIGSGLERSLAWVLPKALAVVAVVAVLQFAPQLAVIAIMLGGLFIIVNGGFGKKSANRKRSH